jgi:SAM-dependent methyltransferase
MLKKNVSVFDSDVRENSGYRYTTEASYSSIVANNRITEATLLHIEKDCTSILDVGCGDGTYSSQIQQAMPAIDVAGFDPAAEAVEVARNRNPHMQFLVGDILRPQTFPERKFDVVILRGVLHHLADPAAAIGNCRKLSDNLLIIEPNGNNPILKVIEKTSRYHREHEEQSFSSRKLRRWCEESGYRLASMEFIGFVPFFFPTLPARLIYFLQPFLEHVPLLCRFFGAQIVIRCRSHVPDQKSAAK